MHGFRELGSEFVILRGAFGFSCFCVATMYNLLCRRRSPNRLTGPGFEKQFNPRGARTPGMDWLREFVNTFCFISFCMAPLFVYGFWS